MIPSKARNLPLSMVTFVFGVLSIPMAFARHLVSLALVLAVLAVVMGWWGRRRMIGLGLQFTAQSMQRSAWGFKAGLVGLAASVVMWALWRSNVLLH
jgi:hypothetical protein